ncbi:hypothetical protein ABL78_2112 [Leptomonas seymouri]|uniref:WW domain-containing protein n=1 Tax=Leptomonas seymouri TaxID=5684 RepID=A0A0N0P7V3_LEPSE|nr:hypothetical protein ABL78_2112 [Leptomonas seymouri]|eukprot:KPI88797.1 hypothetical protein ABL78_2112 [Leptomonas seymouri]
MSGVPAKILVGPTTYVHFQRKHKDYYAPSFLTTPDLPDPHQSPHVWRYTVSPDHNNTVFFYNAPQQRSVWVLPVVHPDGRTEELGEGEVMQAIRETPPYAPSERRRTSEKNRVTTAAPEGKSEARNRSAGSERPAEQGETGEAGADSAGNHSATPTHTKPATPAVVPFAEPASAGLGAEAQEPAPSAASPSGSVSRDRVQAAVLRAQQANPITISIRADESVAVGSDANHSAPSTSLRQRLAAWRAKRHQSPSEPRESGADPASTPVVVAPNTAAAPQEDAQQHQQGMVPSPKAGAVDPLLTVALSMTAPSTTTVETAATASPSPHSVPVTPPKLAASAADAPQLVLSASLATSHDKATPLSSSSKDQYANSNERVRPLRSAARTSSVPSPTDAANSPSFPVGHVDAATRQRRMQEAELAKAAALLHREKINAIEQERAALECRRRALAVELQEAAERARMIEVRSVTEKKLVETQQRLNEERRRRLEVLAESAAAEARVSGVNQYVAKHKRVEEEAVAAVADSFSYAARIAEQLAASAPRPEEVTSALRKKTPPVKISAETAAVHSATSREQHIGQGSQRAPAHASPSRIVGCNTPGGAGSQGGGAKASAGGTPEGPVPARTRERICYGAPFVYDGEVVTYQPARTFMSKQQASLNSKSRQRGGELDGGGLLCSALSPGVPALLAAKRDGAGTQYYDASRQHFFTGEWRNDVREGAGVLSLPHSAVQGHWQRDQLAGSAVVQTKHAKANAVFSTVSSVVPSASSRTTQAEGTADSTTTPNDALTHHLALTGNAVVELDNKALFVGSLKDGRVGAPYVLQLGEGDYIEWLGASKSTSAGRAAGEGRKRQLTAPVSTQHSDARSSSSVCPKGRLSSPLSRSGNAAGSGECRLRFHNGDTYVGHVRHFQLHGMGYYRFDADGQSYTGAFQHGLPHGEGLLIFANGDLYKGQFAKGLFDGTGTYSCKARGYVYEGGWVAGSMSGEGTLSYANGDVWKGTFRDNTRVSGAYTVVA